MRLPPYGKYLHNLQLLNKLPTNDVYVFMGLYAWKKAEAFQVPRPGTMCLPPGGDPEQYDWPVANCDILLFDTGGLSDSFIDQCVIALLRDGANIVRYISPADLLTVYNKDA